LFSLLSLYAPPASATYTLSLHDALPICVKLAATEEMPTVKTYHEDLWAELPDGKSGSIRMSLDLLDALHRRWIAFLRALSESDLDRKSTRLNSSHVSISYAVFCLKKKKK